VAHNGDQPGDYRERLPKLERIEADAALILLRQSNVVTYQNATEDWVRSNGTRGFAPIPEDIDAGQDAIAIADVMRIPVAEVASLPPMLYRDAVIHLQLKIMQHKREMKAAEKRRTHPRARKH
jgi:hypothetical protein